MPVRRLHHDVRAAYVGEQRLERMLDDSRNSQGRGHVHAHVCVSGATVNQLGVEHAPLDEPHPTSLARGVSQIAPRPPAEVIEHDHPVTSCHELFGEVRANEARAAGDQIRITCIQTRVTSS